MVHGPSAQHLHLCPEPLLVRLNPPFAANCALVSLPSCLLCDSIFLRGTGFLQYWTLSNLPLFLLATPMLLVLAYSAADTWSIVAATPMLAQKAQEKSNPVATAVKDSLPSIQQIPLLQCIAAIQLILAVLALTSYHVQIISRLSSAYPVWYWWLAQGLAGGPRSKIAGMFVAFMVMYASIQGILFASFLPPA